MERVRVTLTQTARRKRSFRPVPLAAKAAGSAIDILSLQRSIGNVRTERVIRRLQDDHPGRIPTLAQGGNPTQLNVDPEARSASLTHPVQRFVESEHMEIGADATKGKHGETKTVELAPDYRVIYGEMVAMGGDYFGGIAQKRLLAAKRGPGAETREEIEYVRVREDFTGRKSARTTYSEEAKKSADKRYYTLAASNPSHFVNPETGDTGRSTLERAKAKHYDVEWIGLVAKLKEVPSNAVGHYRKGHLIAIAEAM